MTPVALRRAVPTSLASLLLFVSTGCVSAGHLLDAADPGSAARDTSNPKISYPATTQVLKQSGGTAHFMVVCSGGTSSTSARGTYTTGGGTAIAGTDYTAVSNGPISWSACDNPTPDDGSVQDSAVAILRHASGSKVTFHIDLSATSGATLGTYPEAVVSLEDTYSNPVNVSGFSFSSTNDAWNLTLPVNKFRTAANDFGGAWTIGTSDITGGFADDYFYAGTGSVVFVAPATGATTTPGGGSDHTRSELRELYTGPGSSSNDWTSATGGTLTGTATVNSVATSAGEATIAQIHGQSYAFALLVYRPDTNGDGLGKVEIDTYNTNTSGSAKTYTTILSGVSPTTALSYSLNFKNVVVGSVTNAVVTAIVNGTTKTVTMDSSWKNTNVYFKAGAYHDADCCGTDTTSTQVTYTALSVSHP